MNNLDRLEIASVPVDENCAQVGVMDDYRQLALRECAVFKRQLTRVFGEPPTGARLVTISNPHDFGTYFEVAVEFDTNNTKAVNYAYKLEAETPARWDRIAIEELGSEYFKRLRDFEQESAQKASKV